MTTTEADSRLVAVEVRAIRAEQASIANTNALLTVQQHLGSLEREVREVRKTLAVGLTSVRDSIREIRTDLREQKKATAELSLSEEDFQETPTGSFKVTKDTVVRILGEVETEQDAKRWRALWHRAKWFVFLVVGGGGTFAGERLFEYLAKHL